MFFLKKPKYNLLLTSCNLAEVLIVKFYYFFFALMLTQKTIGLGFPECTPKKDQPNEERKVTIYAQDIDKSNQVTFEKTYVVSDCRPWHDSDEFLLEAARDKGWTKDNGWEKTKAGSGKIEISKGCWGLWCSRRKTLSLGGYFIFK